MVKSPLNYTGGKFRLLPQILPLFPHDIATFVDLFCGGGDVGANVEAQTVVFNDANTSVVSLLRMFANTDSGRLIRSIDRLIRRYGLSDTFSQGYEAYGADSASGLADVNRESFIALRNDLNALRRGTQRYRTMLYTAIIFAFNNQIRFNGAGEYNLPVGKRDFNAHMREKLTAFSDRLAALNLRFSTVDFEAFRYNALGENDFVYADPPYLITCASYNENGGWTPRHETSLYNILDRLNGAGIRFAISNVLENKGRTHTMMRDWLRRRPQYNVHHLNFAYSNSSYHTKGRGETCDEVLITNY